MSARAVSACQDRSRGARAGIIAHPAQPMRVHFSAEHLAEQCHGPQSFGMHFNFAIECACVAPPIRAQLSRSFPTRALHERDTSATPTRQRPDTSATQMRSARALQLILVRPSMVFLPSTRPICPPKPELLVNINFSVSVLSRDRTLEVYPLRAADVSDMGACFCGRTEIAFHSCGRCEHGGLSGRVYACRILCRKRRSQRLKWRHRRRRTGYGPRDRHEGPR